MNIHLGVTQTVRDSVAREELVDGCFAALVPDFVKPAPRERLIRFRHTATYTRVTAPSDALATSLQYFAITPVL